MAATSGGDHPRPQGPAAQALVWPHWPAASESDLDELIAEQQRHADACTEHCSATTQDMMNQRGMLVGQAGDAHQQYMLKVATHADEGRTHFESKVAAGTAYRDIVRGVKSQLGPIADAAQVDWDQAMRSKVPGAVAAVIAKYEPEVNSVMATAWGDLAKAPVPTPVPEPPTPVSNDPTIQAVDHTTGEESGEATDEIGSATDPNADHAEGAAAGEAAQEGGSATDTIGEVANPDGPGQPGESDATAPVDSAMPAAVPPGVQVPGAGQGTTPQLPMPSMPASPLGSGAGSGGGGLSSGLGGSSGGLSSALKPASSIPSASAGTSPASALPQVPSTTPDSFASGLSNAGNSFQSGVASGMGASGAVSPVSQFSQPLQPSPTQQPAVAAPVTGLGAQGVSSAAVPDGPVGGGPTGHGPAAGAPGGAPVGGGGVMPPPMAGGQPLAPYSPPGAGAGGGVPATPTAPASGGPAQSSSAAAPAGAPAMVAGSSGTSTAASAVAASTTDVNPDLWTAQRVLADLVRGTDRSGDLQVVWWAVSVLSTPVGPQTVIASSVGGGGYVPASVYLPVTSRLAVFDSSLTMAWAEDWMGWQSPVAILAAHHERVAETLAGVRVSAIATSEVWPRRPDCGGDFVAIQQKDILQMPGEAPIMDGAHQHRLTAIDPGLARRVAALDRGGDVTAWAGAQLTAAVIRAAMESDETGQKLATPQDAEILEAVNSGRATADRWEAYDQEVAQREGGAVMLPEIHAPRDRDSSPASVDARMWYRHYYRMGRIVELVRCWRSLPVSLADVAYCGLAAGYGSAVVGMIAAMEQHLNQQRPPTV